MLAKFKDFQGLENEAIFFTEFQGCGNPAVLVIYKYLMILFFKINIHVSIKCCHEEKKSAKYLGGNKSI